MNVALWIAQLLVAALFLGSAAAKGTMSKERLIASGQTGDRPIALPSIRLIALAELLGVLGLVLPWATGIARGFTPAAAIGLAVVMVGAAIIHRRIGEPRQALANLVILVVCALVAAGRIAELH